MKTPSTRALIFRVLMILYIFSVAYLCFSHLNNIPRVPRHFLGFETDKLVHFCMFFPFPILAFFAYDHLTQKPIQAFAAIITILAIGGIFAGLTEIIQGMLIYRSEDIRDYKADCLALSISAAIVFIIDLIQMKIKKK